MLLIIVKFIISKWDTNQIDGVVPIWIPGIKSIARTSLRHKYHLVDMVHRLLDLFALRKWNKRRFLLSCRAGHWWPCLELLLCARKSGISSYCFMATEVAIRLYKCLFYLLWVPEVASLEIKIFGFCKYP